MLPVWTSRPNLLIPHRLYSGVSPMGNLLPIVVGITTRSAHIRSGLHQAPPPVFVREASAGWDSQYTGEVRSCNGKEGRSGNFLSGACSPLILIMKAGSLFITSRNEVGLRRTGYVWSARTRPGDDAMLTRADHPAPCPPDSPGSAVSRSGREVQTGRPERNMRA